jgi:hypothetical protein
MLSVIMLIVVMLSVIMLIVVMLIVIMLSVIMLSVVIPSVIKLSVVAPVSCRHSIEGESKSKTKPSEIKNFFSSVADADALDK